MNESHWLTWAQYIINIIKWIQYEHLWLFQTLTQWCKMVNMLPGESMYIIYMLRMGPIRHTTVWNYCILCRLWLIFCPCHFVFVLCKTFTPCGISILITHSNNFPSHIIFCVVCSVHLEWIFYSVACWFWSVMNIDLHFLQSALLSWL